MSEPGKSGVTAVPVPFSLGAPLGSISRTHESASIERPAPKSWTSQLGAAIGWSSNEAGPDGKLSNEKEDERTYEQSSSRSSDRDTRTLNDEKQGHSIYNGPEEAEETAYDTRGGFDGPTEHTVAMTEKQREHSIAGLARQFSRQSVAVTDNLFQYEQGSDLDPFSETFNARKYVKSLAAMSSAEGRVKRSGLAWTNLSVHGYGSDAGKSPRAQAMSHWKQSWS